jgi:preprotein translocase subunit SecG
MNAAERQRRARPPTAPALAGRRKEIPGGFRRLDAGERAFYSCRRSEDVRPGIRTARIGRGTGSESSRGMEGFMKKLAVILLGFLLVFSVAAATAQSKSSLGAAAQKITTQSTSLAGISQSLITSFQNFDQKSQQLLQMLSNVMKMMSDSALSVIRRFN